MSLWSEFKAWWTGTTIGTEIDTAAEAAKTELGSIAEADMATIAEKTAGGILTGLATGGTSAAIAAGVTAAEEAFKVAGAQISTATLGTFVATLNSSISAQQAAGAVTPTA